MKRISLALSAVFWLSVTGQAEPVSLKVLSLKSGYVPGVGRISISPAKGGKLQVAHDRNKCSTDGTRCTRMAVKVDIVEAKVIEDGRPSDGDLLLELTPTIQLSVGSGFNMERRIDYNALVDTTAGKERVKLTPEVYLEVKD